MHKPLPRGRTPHSSPHTWETHADPLFGLHMPVSVPGVPHKEILDPRQSWPDKKAYDEHARKLADLFRENFENFEEEVEVRRAGPR